MIKRIGLLATLSFAVGCAPSIKEHMKSATDKRLAQFAGGSHRESAPDSFDFLEWQAGQWAAFRLVSGKEKHPSYSRVSVLESSADGIWLETETQTYFDRSVSKVLYARMPKSSEEAMDLMKKIIIQTDDQEPQEMDFTVSNPLASMMKRTVRGHAGAGVVPSDVQIVGRTDLTVPAGTFAGCGEYVATISVIGTSFSATSWVHPAVPLGGIVKSVSKDGDYVMELLDYGLTGATSALR